MARLLLSDFMLSFLVSTSGTAASTFLGGCFVSWSWELVHQNEDFHGFKFESSFKAVWLLQLLENSLLHLADWENLTRNCFHSWVWCIQGTNLKASFWTSLNKILHANDFAHVVLASQLHVVTDLDACRGTVLFALGLWWPFECFEHFLESWGSDALDVSKFWVNVVRLH